MTDKEKIRAEVEMRLSHHLAFSGKFKGFKSMADEDKAILSFIDSMQVEPVISVWHNKDDMPIAGKQLLVTYDGLDAKRILTWQKDFITIAIDKWAYIDDLLKL